MNPPAPGASDGSPAPIGTDRTLAFLLLRLWLAARAIVTGLDKFAGSTTVHEPLRDELGNPDPSGAMIAVQQKTYAFANYHGLPGSLMDRFHHEPLLPGVLVDAYAASLGYVLIALGLALLLGVCTRSALFLMGLLYLSLTLGLILIGQDDGVAWLAVHVLMTAVALVLASHNRLRLYNRF